MPARTARKSRRTSKRKKTSSNRKKVKKILAVSYLFLISALFLSGLGFYKNLTKNFAAATSEGDYFISEQDVFSLLYVTVDDMNMEPVLATSIRMKLFDRNNGKVVSYSIPLDMVVDVPGKFGEEEISKVFALGNLNNKEDFRNGISLLDKTVTSLFGFKVNKYIIVDSKFQTEFDSLFETGSLNMTSSLNDLSKFKNSLITDLTFNEFINIYTFTRSLPQDRFIKKDFIPQYTANTSLIDEEVRDLTFDSSIALEKKSIAVLNGAGTPGLAQFGNRIVQNLGGRVVGVGNALQVYSDSYIIVDETDLITTTSLAFSFGIGNIMLKRYAAFIRENELDRADIVVIMGLDIKDIL